MSEQQQLQQQKEAQRGLIITMGVVLLAVAAVAIIGFVFMNRPEKYVEGQVEGTTVRISGKMPGRIVEFYVREGDTVRAGDTLVHIHSSLVDAQLQQAEAVHAASEAVSRRVDAGTRIQVIHAAQDIVAQAEAAVTITRRTYERLERLYSEGVVTEQQRDEARAAYDAAVAGHAAAQSQLELAQAGAQAEERQAAAATAQAAGSAVDQVEAVLEDAYLVAPFDGTIDQIYPEEGELIFIGAPVMSLLRTDHRWVNFNVREELLRDLPIGHRLEVYVPALDENIEVEVYFIRDMGTYATWRSTKSTGSYDSRTFQVKARPTGEVRGLRPGMSAIYDHNVGN